MEHLVGRTFTLNGLTLRVVRLADQGATAEVHTVGGYGVWFATAAQLAAVGVV